MEKIWLNVFGKPMQVAYATKEEFSKISGELDSPEAVLIKGTGKVLYNDFTCLSSYKYGGTCRCINHPPKSWVEVGWSPIGDKKLHRDLILSGYRR